jgi:AAA15 family ATPase/GTPase
MIVNFSVQNFGPIKDKVLLSFSASNSKDLEEYCINQTEKKGLRLLKLGLIYGSNASGKTTILQALDFLRDLVVEPLKKKTDTFNFKPFLFNKNTPKENTHFSLEFIQQGTRYLFELELNEKAIISEKLVFFKPNKAVVYERTTDLEKQLTLVEFGSKIKISKDHKAAIETNTLWNNTVLGGYLKTNIESLELQEATDWFKEKFNRLIEPKTDLYAFVSTRIENQEIVKSNVVELLKKADFNITNIIIDKHAIDMPPDFFEFISKTLSVNEEKLNEMRKIGKMDSREIIFEHKFSDNNIYSLPYNSESQGTKRYYQFSGLLDLLIRNEAIFLIDELESSLHPDLLKYFLLTFLVNSKNSQLIATTHQRELLMEKDIFRNDVIWFTEKREDGSTELYSLSDFDSSIIRQTSSIYNAYKSGKLGANPNLNDFYIDLEYEK